MASRYEYNKPCRNDPFYEPPLHKAFYHPTTQKDLPDDKKWISLGAERDRLPPDARDIHFLQPTNTYTTTGHSVVVSPGDTSSKFDESWPASERPSTLDNLPDEVDTAEPQHDESSLGPMKPLSSLLKDYGIPSGSRPRLPLTDLMSDISRDGDTTVLSQATSATEPPNKSSTLSKYIERFRHGAPMSREERLKEQATNPRDFWWLGSSSPQGSSTPRDTSGSETKISAKQKVQQRLLQRERSKFSSPSESGHTARTHYTSELDSETLRLQDKTDRLLEKSESSLDSSAPVVSTVGLGSDTSASSSVLPTTTTGPRETSYLPSFVSRGKTPGPSHESQRSLRPQDDILYQWRQQRRMEALRHKASRLLTTADNPTAEVIDDVESRLAEFRRRVCLGPKERMSHNIPHNQRPSQQGQDQSREPDHNPQIVLPPKADAECQTRNNTDAVCQTSPDLPSTPKKEQAGFMHAPIASTQHHSPIASPSLSRKKLKAQSVETDMEPHFHLSCDIIPCPHEIHHSPKKIPTKSVRSPQHRKHKSYHSDTDTDESRPPSSRNVSEEVPVRDISPLVIDSCSDVEYEKYKKRHMEELQEELESQTGSECYSGRTEKSNSADKGADCSKNAIVNHEKAVQRTERERKSEEVRAKGKVRDKQKPNTERGRREVDVGHQETMHSKSERSRSREKRESKRSRSRDRTEKQLSDSENKAGFKKPEVKPLPRNKRDKAETVSKSETDTHRPKTHQDKVEKDSTTTDARPNDSKPKTKSGRHSPQPREGRSREVAEVSRSRKPVREELVRGSLTDASICDVTPLCHSSPIRDHRAVTPTIQQVVTERLFEDTKGSEATAASEDIKTETVTDSDGIAMSDGEEYIDDEILAELRTRREQYLQRLQIIDQLLALTTDS